MRPRALAAVVASAVVVAIVPLAGVAHARWDVGTTGGNGFARADSMPAGNAPTASGAVRAVDVSWSAVNLAGPPVNTYRVKRYDGSGALQTILSNCDGTITGLSCTEQNVPAGTWHYTVTPVFHNWVGGESAQSAAVTVQAPTLTLDAPTTLNGLPDTLTGSLAHFRSGQAVTFRLDDPATGTPVVGTIDPAVIGAAGTASVSVTVPVGVSNGTHTLYALGSDGDTASATFDVNVIAPAVSSLLTADGGAQPGRPQQGDRVEVTFNQRLAVASMCSTWSGNASNQSITGSNVVTVHIDNNAAASGNDRLRVTTSAGACAGLFNFGTIDLGDAGYVAGDTTFNGAGAAASTIAWDATAFKLTVTLGARATGANPARINQARTSTYTPAALTTPSGALVTGTASYTGIQL